MTSSESDRPTPHFFNAFVRAEQLEARDKRSYGKSQLRIGLTVETGWV